MHLSTPLPGDARPLGRGAAPRRTGALRDGRAGERLALPGGAAADAASRRTAARGCGWRGSPLGGPLPRLPAAPRRADPLRARARPLAARRLPDRVRARARAARRCRAPAGRSRRALVTRLVARGIDVAPLVLHTGVSSLELGEPPLPRALPRAGRDRRLVNGGARRGRARDRRRHHRRARARVAPRATDGDVRPAARLDRPGRSRPSAPVRAVDGLLTGFHDAGASHLRLLEAVAGRDRCWPRATRAAAGAGYLWHEFGDVAPARARAAAARGWRRSRPPCSVRCRVMPRACRPGPPSEPGARGPAAGGRLLRAVADAGHPGAAARSPRELDASHVRGLVGPDGLPAVGLRRHADRRASSATSTARAGC